MSWGDVGESIEKYAPMVGLALSSPMGTAVAVGQLVANLFGTKADPQDVLNYINTNPEKAQERLQFELSNNIDFQKVVLAKIQENNRHDEAKDALIIQDKMSARQNSENINRSPVDNWIKMIIVLGELLFLGGCISAIILFKENIDSTEIGILSTIIGFLSKSVSTKDDFYWGSAFEKPNIKN